MEEGTSTSHLNFYPPGNDWNSEGDRPVKSVAPSSKPEQLLQEKESCVILEQKCCLNYVCSNGDYIVAAGPGNELMVWDVEGGLQVRRLAGHSGPVTGIFIMITTTESLIISSSLDGSIKQWSSGRGEELRTTDTGCAITCMAAVFSGCLVATGNNRGQLEVRNLSTGKVFISIKAHTSPIHALAVSDDIVCTSTFDKPCSIKLWSIEWSNVCCVNSLDLPHYPDDYGSVALSGNIVFLGNKSAYSKIFVHDFDLDIPRMVNVSGCVGGVHCLIAEHGMVLAAATDKNSKVSVYVYKEPELKVLRTIPTSMEHVTAMSLVGDRKGMRLVLAGSSLIVMKFERTASPKKMCGKNAKMQTTREWEISGLFQNSPPPGPPHVLEHEGAGDTPEAGCSKTWTRPEFEMDEYETQHAGQSEKATTEQGDGNVCNEGADYKAVIEQLDQLMTGKCSLREEMMKLFEKAQGEGGAEAESTDSESDEETTAKVAPENSTDAGGSTKMDEQRGAEVRGKSVEESDTESSIEENLDILPIEEYTDEFRAALRRAEENNPFRKKVVLADRPAVDEPACSHDGKKPGSRFRCGKKYSKLKQEEEKKSKTKLCALV